MKSRALALDSSYLFIQGPPGAGKTWAGARLIAHLLENGKRVGVAAQSHKAIHNLLNEIEKFARENGLSFRGLKKSSSDNPESIYEGEFIKSEPQFKQIAEARDRIQLLAGTGWLFSRHELDRSLDYLVIDEAGQVSLAGRSRGGDRCAKFSFCSVIHCSSSRCRKESIHRGLAHLSWNICSARRRRFQKTVASSSRRATGCIPMSAPSFRRSFYAGRLHSDESAARRNTSFGTGIRFVPVEHDGNRTASDEELAEIAKLIAELKQGTFTDSDGSIRATSRR